jgi:tRNA(adenine34) deaminase
VCPVNHLIESISAKVRIFSDEGLRACPPDNACSASELIFSFYFCLKNIFVNRGTKDEIFMRAAIAEAHSAGKKNEVPVGAVIVSNGIIIARAHNLTETLNDPTAHAEMQAITAATNYLGGKYLPDCSIYVTVEPCAMCAGALGWSQVSEIIYGCDDVKKGYSLIRGNLLHPKTKVRKGILGAECAEIMSSFFRTRRQKL